MARPDLLFPAFPSNLPIGERVLQWCGNEITYAIKYQSYDQFYGTHWQDAREWRRYWEEIGEDAQLTQEANDAAATLELVLETVHDMHVWFGSARK